MTLTNPPPPPFPPAHSKFQDTSFSKKKKQLGFFLLSDVSEIHFKAKMLQTRPLSNREQNTENVRILD